MTFLPIVGRELRVTARRRGTYLNRALSALAAILIFGGTLIFKAHSPPKDLGKDVFDFLAGLFVLSSLAAGVRYTADCLSEEKREGTLGLLFLTDLRGYDVVLGKLAATSLNCIYALLAIFPVLAIPLLLGGVTLDELWRMALVLVNALFFSLSAGICISTMSKNPRKAMFCTLLLILLVHGGLPVLGAWMTYRYYNGNTLNTFFLPSAGYAYLLAFDAGFKSRPGEYLQSMLVIHGLGWVLLALASIIVRHSWQDKPAGTVLSRWQQRWQQWSYGHPAQRLAFRARLLNINPCLWLGGRHRLKPALVWGALGLGTCVWVWGAFRWGEDWLNELTYVFTAVVLHLTFKFWVASEACLRLGPDHRSGALELVLSTPLTVREILRGQMLALRRQFFWPVLLVVGLDFVFLLSASKRLGPGGDNQWVWFSLGAILTFVGDVYTLCWVGMWVGLISKRPNRATFATFARVVVVPCGAWSAMVILISLLELWPRLDQSGQFSMVLWFGFGLANDIALFLWSRHRLVHDLRVVATQRFVPGRPLLGWRRSRNPAANPALPPTVTSAT
jgi:ABC-type transport system involved in multi-copper enzyme maturation permease subunit